jgi:hypothetical protein
MLWKKMVPGNSIQDRGNRRKYCGSTEEGAGSIVTSISTGEVKKGGSSCSDLSINYLGSWGGGEDRREDRMCSLACRDRKKV